MTHKVYAPNVHLFAFHLRNSPSGEYPEVPTDNLLWQKCDQIFEKLKVENLKLTHKLASENPSDSPRVNLLGDGEISENHQFSLPFDCQLFTNGSQDVKAVKKISGFVYPLQTHDSYAVWLNLRRPDRENGKRTEYVDLSILGQLNPDGCLLPEFIESSLGQTLLITVWLTEGQNYQDKQFLKELADECVEHFIPEPEMRPKFNRDGLLFGSPIFEYGIINQPPPYQHILVWLFCHSVTDTKFEKCYKDLMDLFYYRNKIVHAYKNSRQVYKELYQEYKEIEGEINTINDLSEGDDLNFCHLANFKRLLKLIPKKSLEYSGLLRNLDQCRHIIKINAHNYEEKVNNIQEKLQSDNLEFLEIFSQKNCLYLQEEIEADLRYFHHGSRLLEKMLSAIRGMVEIEKAERERYRQATIKALGIGIGTGIIVASSSTQITSSNPIKPPFSSKVFHPFTTSFFLSFFVAFIAALMARWIFLKED